MSILGYVNNTIGQSVTCIQMYNLTIKT